MSKLKIVDRRSEQSITGERNLLSNLNHPFIVNMYFAFQDFYNLYLVMDLLTGGDLRYHIAYKHIFSEEETKFFISNMILALDYIHSKNIIHRDIKPENLVLENSGYLRITDFGVAKINEKDNSSETSGTPGYMAPEVILVLNHTFSSDFFALGVIGYEFMKGYRPYLGRTRNEIKQLIVNKQARIKKNEIPENWSTTAVDFINKLLIRKANKRLGSGGINELKEHPWMKDINWDMLIQKKIKPPFIPEKTDNFDKNYCEGDDEIGEETIERYQLYASSGNFADVFKNYTFCNLSYISNYHIKRLKRFKENNINIRNIVEKNINKALEEKKEMKDEKEEKEEKEENEEHNIINKIKRINDSLNSIKINKNNSEINIDKEKLKNKKNNKIKNHSKSVEDLKQYNINNKKDNKDINKDNKNTIDSKSNKEEIISHKYNKKNINTNKKPQLNNNNIKINNENYFTIETDKIKNYKKRKKISASKIKTTREFIDNFKENIIYNNYINLHFNDFSTNKNFNNSNNINIESMSSNKRKISSKLSSNITNKTKSKINMIKNMNKKNSNKIVKSSSVKIFENNKNVFNEILNEKPSEKNIKILNHINHIKLEKYRNKKIFDTKKEIKTTKSGGVQNLNLIKKISNINHSNVNKIFNKKIHLFMDLIYDNVKNVNLNLNSGISKHKKTENILNINNHIGKCHSSCGFYTNSKTINASRKKTSNLKFAKKRRNLSMQNISNNDYDLHKNINNYNTLNINYHQNSKNSSIKYSSKNKNYNTFYSLNNTVKNIKKEKNKFINKKEIKNYFSNENKFSFEKILNTKNTFHYLDEKRIKNNKNTISKNKSKHKNNNKYKNH